MARFRLKFDPTGGAILACVDVGKETYWWDYGRLGLYLENNELLTQSSASADALRTFLGITTRKQANALGSEVKADESAVMLKCSIGGGSVGKGSVLVNVSAPHVEVENCILMNVTSLTPIRGKGGLLYNVVHEATDGELEANAVRADVFMPGGEHLIMASKPSIDGGEMRLRCLAVAVAASHTILLSLPCA